MKAFRFVALGYALSVFLVAPGWLAADEEPVPPAEPVVQEPAAPATAPAEAAAPATDPPAPAPAPAGEQPPPVAVSQEAETASATPAAKAPQAKAAKKQDEPVAKAAAFGAVTISDFKFSPATLTVHVGDTVTWTNAGPTPHSATAKDGSFDTGILNKGKSGSATFSTAGTIAYICTPHPFMHGTIVVAAAPSASGGSGDSSSEPTATIAGDSGGLPNTGGETLLIALLGVVTLAIGLWLRRGPRTTSRT